MSKYPRPTIVVPARLASSRFPKKLLADAGGMPLILRTANRLRNQVPEYDLVFAVDGEEIAQPLKQEGFTCIFTDPDLASGTDRVAQANKILQRDEILNVQADEPMVMREHILALDKALKRKGADLATLAAPFEKNEDFQAQSCFGTIAGFREYKIATVLFFLDCIIFCSFTIELLN